MSKTYSNNSRGPNPNDHPCCQCHWFMQEAWYWKARCEGAENLPVSSMDITVQCNGSDSTHEQPRMIHWTAP